MSALSPDQLSSIRSKLLSSNQELTAHSVVTAMREILPTVSQTDLLAGTDQVLANTIGFGPIDDLLNKVGVTDVLVNSYQDVWFDRGSGLEKSEASWINESELREFAARLAASVNRRLDDVSPFVDAQLQNGIRFHAIIPPLAKTGTVLSFRIPAKQQLNIADLINLGSIDANVAAILKQLIRKKISIAISGNTGSGKTTMLGALLSEVSTTERILVIEDSSELNISHPHVISLQTRNPNAEGIGEIKLSQLIKQALRMRPDRIVLGEVRGVEVLDLLVALNTGHEGGCVTIHANSTNAVIARFEALGLLAKIPRTAIQALLKQAIQVLIHVQRTPAGRKVSEISLIESNLDGSIYVEPALNLLTNQHFDPGWPKLQKLLAS